MIRDYLRKKPILYSTIRTMHIYIMNIVYFPKRLVKSIIFQKELLSHFKEGPKVWYFCVPVHNNLGDYAQYCCIKEWLSKNYPDRAVIEIPTAPIRYDYIGMTKKLKKLIDSNDLIVFQSGYTSSNLHEDELVHRKIVSRFDNKILFFPQTVKYSSEKEAKKTAIIYNQHENLTFMARDKVSYETAKKYFYKTKVILVPDIVTTKIGKAKYTNNRVGIVFCIRHDSEKKYSDKLIKTIFSEISSNEDIWTDTTLNHGEQCSENLIEEKIEQFSKHKLTITDRFHGTILSLAASTPVIVLKTTDHKVTEGAEWFKNVIPKYIRVAENIEEAYKMAKQMLEEQFDNINEPYFEQKYYDNLKNL